MQKYGYENKAMHELFFKVLEGYEPPNEEETLYGVMDYIQDYLESCFWLGINPLREVRQMLPQYKWQFHRSADKSHIKKAVADSHLVWRVNWSDDFFPGPTEEIQLVTAGRFVKGSKLAENLFFAGTKKRSEQSTDRLDFVKKYGGDPVYAEVINR